MKLILQVQEKCKQHRLAIKLTKCEFYKKKLKFLNYIVSGQGIKMYKDCIELIIKWSTSKSIKQVERFLRFGNFYR